MNYVRKLKGGKHYGSSGKHENATRALNIHLIRFTEKGASTLTNRARRDAARHAVSTLMGGWTPVIIAVWGFWCITAVGYVNAEDWIFAAALAALLTTIRCSDGEPLTRQRCDVKQSGYIDEDTATNMYRRSYFVTYGLSLVTVVGIIVTAIHFTPYRGVATLIEWILLSRVIDVIHWHRTYVRLKAVSRLSVRAILR